MTLVSLPSPITFPGLMIGPYGAPGLGTVATLDASGKYVSYIFSAREDMTISHVGFLVGAVTNSPTLDVRIETVDTGGLPSGSLWAANTNIVSGVLSSGWTLQALTAPASVTKGQLVCVKLVWQVATSTIIIQHLTNTVAGLNSNNLPYSVINTGTPTRTAIGTLPSIAIGSGATSFYNVVGMMPFTAYTASNFNNTNSAARGLRFTPNFNCRAVGVRWYKTNSTGDYTIGLYTGDASGTELSSSSTAIDGDVNASSANSSVTAFFDNPVTLTAGTAYRVAVTPTSATNCNMSTLTLPSADYFSATPASSTSVGAYTSLVSGTWTDSTTQIPLMDVILDQVDDGTGTGGVVGVIGG